jgi:hypothetical protein
MNLQQIIDMEKRGFTAINTVQSLPIQPEFDKSLDLLIATLAEIRHFAVIWDDQRRREDIGDIDAIKARDIRDEAINRLATHLIPTRL